MRSTSNIRKANGFVSAAIAVFFLVHGTLGAFSAATGYRSTLSALAWAGVALVALHIVLSVFSSHEQLADAEHPASARKKRHLALKWATGLLLAAAAAAHILTMRAWGIDAEQTRFASMLLTIAPSVVLAAHICVGAKSLLKDIGIDRRYLRPLRTAVGILCFLFAVTTVVGIMA